MGSPKSLLSMRIICFLNKHFTFIDLMNSPYFENCLHNIGQESFWKRNRTKWFFSSPHNISIFTKKCRLHNTFSKWKVLNKMKNKCTLKVLLNCDFSWKASISFILLEQECVYLNDTDRCKNFLGACSGINIQTSKELFRLTAVHGCQTMDPDTDSAQRVRILECYASVWI